MYSETKNEKFIVYEYKKSGTDVTTLVDAIKAGINYIKTDKLFFGCYHKEFITYADTSDQKISLEFSTRHGIPVHPAMKHDKALAIQTLQEETKRRQLKIKKDSIFDEEALRIIFKRVEVDGQPSIITKEIDDEVYHPDLMDAILYSLRYYWISHSPDHFTKTLDKVIVNPNLEYWETIEQNNRKQGEQLY